MVFALRLIQGGAIARAGLSPVSVQDTGFWNNISEPRAAYYNGKTYFTAVDSAGNITAASYNHSTGATSTPFTIGTGYSSADGNIHNAAVILVRSSDHKLVTAMCSELASQVQIRISTNAEDATAWGAATNILAANAYTYPSLFQTNDGTIWLFLKYHTTVYPLGYTKSTDGGVTWSAVSGLVGPRTTNDNYWRIACDGTNFHIFTTDTGRQDATPSALYHFKFDGTALYKSDGTSIAGPYPVTADNGTLVHNASPGSAWADGACVDTLGRPACVALVWDGVSQNDIYSAYWNGTSWALNHVDASGGLIIGSAKFIAGAAIAKTDPWTIWANKKVGEHFELYRYRSTDSGSTWTALPVTVNSSSDNCMPDTPMNAAAGFPLIWGQGLYTSDSNFTFTVRGGRT